MIVMDVIKKKCANWKLSTNKEERNRRVKKKFCASVGHCKNFGRIRFEKEDPVDRDSFQRI